MPRRRSGLQEARAGLAGATPAIERFWALPAAAVLGQLGCSDAGLPTGEVALRQARYGPNQLAPPRRGGTLAQLARRFTDPVVLILLFAAVLAIVLKDLADALIILAIVVLSGLLGFWQEHRAGVALQQLLALVQVGVDVRRGGAEVEIQPAEVVPGDLVVLNAGDLIPCDCRLLRAHDLQVDDSALTGETFPRHKHPDPAPAEAPLAERHSALFLGSHVVSGRGEAVAVATGASTELGRLSRRLDEVAPRTGFEQGIARFGLLLARVTAVLTAAMLVVNLLLGRRVVDSLLFSLALAVGLTPQLLPAIVAVSLSTGARRMASRRVIVRRLDAIEDFGAMDVLCTDKTGTLTEGAVRLHAALDLAGGESRLVAERATLIAGLQTGFDNPIDAAILERGHPDPRWRALDEVPFDFSRKRLSVLVDGPDGRLLLTKGAFASVLAVCGHALGPHGTVPIGQLHADLEKRHRELSDAGYRVLGVAERDLPGHDAVALHLADVGISVDTAVDVAKSAAAIVLLDKDLGVLAEGVRLGRQTFANTLKYVFTTVSANFGNMASMAAASAFLPFLPLLPRQILVLNFLSDIPSTTIATDAVDPEQRQRPQRWDIRFIRDFMIVFGLLSSAFDLLTFTVLLHLFDAGPDLFRTGWFVGSTLTELAVLLVLRTRRPALRSRPGTGLLLSSLAVTAVTLALPYLRPLAEPLALVPLPATMVAALAAITLAYVASAETVKRSFYRAVDRPARDPAGAHHPRRLARVAREHDGQQR